MNTTFNLRTQINPTLNYRTAISKAQFESLFTKTKEKITYTFNGWDGKSYDGESRTNRILHINLEGFEDLKFIKVGKAIHQIDTEKMVTEKATGESHPTAHWLMDVVAE